MKALFTLMVTVVVLISCTNEDIGDTPKGRTPLKIGNLLGKKLENPYSVANMRRALGNLNPSTRSGLNEVDIQATHYYVKFKPETNEELNLLKQDSTIFFYEYPLDHELGEEFEGSYHDPSIPDSLPTYQYASVSIEKWAEIKNISVKYEILEDLFIPDEDKDDETGVPTRSGIATTLNEVLAEDLVDEALRITGNDEKEYVQTRARSKWRPAGKILYYDEVNKKYIGLEGIKVKARRWFTTHRGFVDINGYYSCNGRFRRRADYSFDLERSEFHVKGAKGVQTDFSKRNRKGDWNYTFSRSESQTKYFAATIFRAAYHYYYKNIEGLRRPPQNSFWRTQMKLKGFDETSETNGNFNSAKRFLGLGNPIKLYNPHRKMVDIYATTIHELAHAAHWRMIVKKAGTNRLRDYHNAETKMVESWATGVQWYLTKMVYPQYKGREQGTPNYTNVVIDLVDSKSDDGTNNGKSDSQGDKVTGYSMYQIETALQGCNTWNKWRNKIKQYENKTKQYVDTLFAAW